MLTVTTATSDLNLLTIAELRAAVGVENGSQDAKLTTLGKRVSASLAAACRVAAGGTSPPTLRLETLTETLRLKSTHKEIILSRVPIVSVTSVTEADIALAVDGTDFETEANAGMLRRLSSDEPTDWAIGKIVVVYQAGWQIIPDNLKNIAAELAQTFWANGNIDDQSRTSMEIPGVYKETRWVETDTAPIPEKLMAALVQGGFVNHWIG